MTHSPASNSDSRSFDQLDQRIQQWIWGSGWTELREAQERAIPLILNGGCDVIIAASTASGKTEAAFFPILTNLAYNSKAPSLALYVSPLKALINDQWRRLDELAERLEIPVTPWHGDIGRAKKSSFLKDPRGCLLITPESLESLLLHHGSSLAGLFAGLRYIVVDELHAFLGTERGKQLQALLHRIEKVLGRRICRVGLSATLGDMEGAKQYLRPETHGTVELIVSKDGAQELKVLVKGMIDKPVPPKRADSEQPESPAKVAIAAHMFRGLRGSSNLVFPNSRQEVEYYSDRLRRLCESQGVPNEFWPHHGNLSKEIREETEAALKQTERPATAICTSTLELGIDIGPVKSIVQIGPPPSVASLRQRLGRSGRRKGEPMILRAYSVERQISPDSRFSDLLREGMVQMIAMVRLLTGNWYEPISTEMLHGSTLVQQILSVLAQHGGLYAQQMWELLCGAGPFSMVSKNHFLQLLRKLGEEEIIFQDATGLLLLAPRGEHITEDYRFYAAFTSDEEFRIVAGNRTLGSMPVSRPLTEGSFLIFAGHRWQVISVSQTDKVIDVQPAAAGAVPGFDGASGAMVHDRVRQEMCEILRSNGPVPFLDETGQMLLQEARGNYARLGLDDNWLLQDGNETRVILWRGDKVNDTLLLMLQSIGYKGLNDGVSVLISDSTVEKVRSSLAFLSAQKPVDPVGLASSVQNKVREKWDGLLPNDLLDVNFASSCLNVAGALDALKVHFTAQELRRK